MLLRSTDPYARNQSPRGVTNFTSGISIILKTSNRVWLWAISNVPARTVFHRHYAGWSPWKTRSHYFDYSLRVTAVLRNHPHFPGPDWDSTRFLQIIICSISNMRSWMGKRSSLDILAGLHFTLELNQICWLYKWFGYSIHSPKCFRNILFLLKR